MNRKDKIVEIIKQNNMPISASRLATDLGVSRQVIVGDVALLRASGINIIATPRGYILDDSQKKTTYIIAVQHNSEDTEDELYTIVDFGASVIDVIVEHPIYGQLTGNLHLQSRYDVNEYLNKVSKSQASPLSQLTDGVHLHTIQCDSKEIFNKIITTLDQKGYLHKA